MNKSAVWPVVVVGGSRGSRRQGRRLCSPKTHFAGHLVRSRSRNSSSSRRAYSSLPTRCPPASWTSRARGRGRKGEERPRRRGARPARPARCQLVIRRVMLRFNNSDARVFFFFLQCWRTRVHLLREDGWPGRCWLPSRVICFQRRQSRGDQVSSNPVRVPRPIPHRP